MSKNNDRKEILGTTVITHKSQITIPKKVREKYSFQGGDIIVFIDVGNRLIVKKGTEFFDKK